MESEILMNLKPKSDFERLLWERNKTKAQAEFIEAQTREIKRLKEVIKEKTELLAVKKLGNQFQELQNKITEKNEKINNLTGQNKKLKVQNELLIEKIAKFNLKNQTQ